MKKKISIRTASAIVIANMIGTGVFTSLGFQLTAIQNTWSILLLWLLGGILALLGAFAYAELGTHFKENGGDYIFLSRVFHPMVGYLSAWACLTVGFSAPVALAAMAFTKYLSPFGWANNVWLAIGIIVSIGIMHSFTIKHSSRFQNISTIIKIIFIVTLIVLGYSVTNHLPHNALNFSDTWKNEIVKPGFAVSMVYVAFSYTGWNAAAYIVDEIDNVQKNLPKALIGSTLFVALVYVLFQLVLLKNASVASLSGKEEVTFISFTNVLGNSGAKWVSIFIAFQLVATISSYLWIGSRVTWALAKENTLWKPLAKQNLHQIPVAALWAHVAIAILLTVTGSFERIMLYAGFILQLMTSLTIASSLFLQPKPYKVFTTPFKPLLQLIFLTFNVWVLVFTIIDKPIESCIGIGIMFIGLIIYLFDKPTINR